MQRTNNKVRIVKNFNQNRPVQILNERKRFIRLLCENGWNEKDKEYLRRWSSRIEKEGWAL